MYLKEVFEEAILNDFGINLLIYQMAANQTHSRGKHIWASSSFLFFHAGISLSRNYSMPTTQLVHNLLQDYDPRLLPVENFGDNVSIAVNIALRQLMKLVQFYHRGSTSPCGFIIKTGLISKYPYERN